MSFYSLFKSLSDKKIEIIVELNNGDIFKGQLNYCDSYLNINIIKITDCKFKYLKNIFIRGSNIKFINFSSSEIDDLYIEKIFNN